MRKIAAVIICLVAFSFMGKADDLLKKAEVAYDSKSYKEAIASYEKLISGGFHSYQLYFNLGNSYYRDNELGKAIYYYELARKIEPNDEDVRINLGIAASKTIDKIDSKENFFITAVKSNILSSFSTRVWAWLSIISVLVTTSLFLVFVVSGNLIVKRISFVLSMLALISFVTTYSLGYSALNAKYENKFGIIIIKEVRITNEPTPMAKTKFSLHEGTKIRVVENNGDWILIKLDNGNEGWVKLSEVGII
ncbi:MAG: tetratricopeptide repeat protein [bacterium]|nr:tetratricopeptide repeat protein [bacterium]